jgi:lipoprotein NlpI
MKRIVLCLDGTWNHNRLGAVLTNVYKLHQVIAPTDANGVRQFSNYIGGIDSADGESLQFLKGGIGYGVDNRVRKAYEALVKDYEPGDEIFLVGFSRGAFEARSLGGLITLIGVAKPGLGFSFDRAWSVYRTREKGRDQAALAQLRAATHYPVRIRCVGVWDTVGNLGNPFVSGGIIGRRYEFHDTRLTDNIDVGLHALSIDEIRGPFRPTPWTSPKDQALPANQHVEQVWFAGTHADVGGGHRETALSDIALIWMAERLQATAGLALDMHKLGHMTRPDPLGPQHSVAEGWIFKWSGRLPFIRLVRQATAAIPPLRRSLIGSWRAGKLPRGVEVVNESVHPSVLERFGKRVIELRIGRSHMITYRPRNLAAALPERPVVGAAKPGVGQPRRVKVFTVHGTFAHETDWDDWDRADEAKKPQRAFINQLAGHLKERGVALEELDHTQYNWSGGNSHDERRVAAIGLKKMIQEELTKSYDRHGEDYYDKVFIVGHSHGGTISRLAMNLWDKDDDYYDPIKTAQFDELKHDDECPTCLRIRNGHMGRNSVRRPDGVITFGSPFVSFEKRSLGLFTARLSAWVFRILIAIPLGLLLYLAYSFRPYPVVSTLWENTPAFVKANLLLTSPLALYWLVGSYLGKALDVIERWFGKRDALFALSAVFQTFKYVVLAGVAAYYVAYLTGEYNRVLQWLPVSKPWFQTWFGWSAVIGGVLFLLVAVPGAFLAWLRREVGGLRERLPKKYDPAEDRLVPYLSYHTPGDEAGLHLRIFGVLTWAVQTLALSAACVLAFGLALMAIIGIESALGLSQGGSVLNRSGISAVSDFPEFRDRFIALVDALTYLPKLVWSDILGAKWLPSLGGLENRREVAWFVPIALVLSILVIFLLLMPFVVVAIAIVYLASMWLRGSGVVFGSEKLSWNLANHIAVTRHPNENTTLRVLFISPEAWWRREIAHSYYYKSGRVIADAASHMADWSNLTPTPAWPVGAWFAATARLLVVMLFVLSIFAVSVPIAAGFASVGQSVRMFLGDSFGGGPGALPEPKDAAAYMVRGSAFRAKGLYERALADHTKAIELEPGNPVAYNDRGVAHQAKRDHDLAIADYTKAIELNPGYVNAYVNRATAYRSKGDPDAAVTDYTKAIELEPGNVRALNRRAFTYQAKGDNAQAIADYARVVEIDPKNSGNHRSLGLARYGAGDYLGASADLLRAIELQDDPYAMLFRYLARTRAGEAAAAELEANVGRLKTKDWPYAVAELYLDKRSSPAVLSTASKPEERCEAQFYIGEWHILKSNAAEAADALQAAVDACPKTFIEYLVAIVELKRLKS